MFRVGVELFFDFMEWGEILFVFDVGEVIVWKVFVLFNFLNFVFLYIYFMIYF